ncbi:replication initiation protein [Variovorax sp. GT1P44]|uniref:replication initiation protein n=1 Tax=Variovorax sp. GT1P44 TaxID=3443742 RepID=UPI003F448373
MLPDTERSANFECRVFKRDVLNKAIAQLNQISDIELEMVEYKSGRFISALQFRVGSKRQRSLMTEHDRPVDLALVGRAEVLGIDPAKAEPLMKEFGVEAFEAGLNGLERRIKSDFAEPVRDPAARRRSSTS